MVYNITLLKYKTLGFLKINHKTFLNEGLDETIEKITKFN